MPEAIVGCVRCPLPARRPINGDRAAELFARLRRFLTVVPAWGCYTPRRGKGEPGDHAAWPLHAWLTTDWNAACRAD